MSKAIPNSELGSLEQHRAEAQRYLPKTDQQYQDDIDNGRDAYASKWFGWALVAASFAVAIASIIDLACGGSAQC